MSYGPDAPGARPLVIVGAGPAGLATAGVARRLGVEPLVLDRRGEVGGAWTAMRPRMRCLSLRRYDRMPDGSVPEGPGDRATAAAVLRWARDYADRERFTVQLGVEVAALARIAGRIHVTLRGGAVIAARRVVVASGEHAQPQVPDLPGHFDGPSAHAAALDIAQVQRGERVLLVGARNSAAEVLPLLLHRGALVTLSARSGLDTPVGIARGLKGALQWRLSGARLRFLPERGGCEASTPTVDDTLQKAREHGQIAVVGGVERLAADHAICGGRPVGCDRIVWATGFRRDLAWLPAELARDGDGFPLHDEGLSRQWPELGFVGLPCQRTRRSGFLRGFVGDAQALLERML